MPGDEKFRPEDSFATNELHSHQSTRAKRQNKDSSLKISAFSPRVVNRIFALRKFAKFSEIYTGKIGASSAAIIRHFGFLRRGSDRQTRQFVNVETE